MIIIDSTQARLWQQKYKLKDYDPRFIFSKSNSKDEILFSLGFFLAVMSIEILFNQPFKTKIGIFHNNFYKTIFRERYERIERVQVNSFAFSLFLILQKLFEEEDSLKPYVKQIIENVVCHWSCIEKLDKKNHSQRLKKIYLLWDETNNIVLSRTYESRIDLIFLLYKSFEVGVGDKKIIKKNISVLIFSVSKAQKEFRYDVLRELKKKKL